MSKLLINVIGNLGRQYELCANDSACPEQLFDHLQSSFEKFAQILNLDNYMIGSDVRLKITRDKNSFAFAFGIVNPSVSEDVFERVMNCTKLTYRPEANAYNLTHNWHDPKTGKLDATDVYDYGVTYHDIRMIHFLCMSAIYTTLEGDSRNIEMLDPLHFGIYKDMHSNECSLKRMILGPRLAMIPASGDAP